MPKKRSNFQNKSELLAVRSLLGAIGALPLETSMRFGVSLGKFIGSRFPRLRRTARRNLEIALPELPAEEKERIVRGAFESLGRQLGAVAHFQRFEPENIGEIIEIEGLEHCERARADGRGVVFFTAHFGGWELSHLAVSAAGYPMNILVRRIDNYLIDAFVGRLRTRFGSRSIEKTVSARALFRLLKKGEFVGILADLNTQEHEGIFVDFFGVAASTTTSVAKLALQTDSIILPGFAAWQPEKGKYVLRLEAPLAFEKTDDNKKDVFEITQKVTRTIEKYVRRYPEQWLWIHKRWNTRPKGEPELY